MPEHYGLPPDPEARREAARRARAAAEQRNIERQQTRATIAAQKAARTEPAPVSGVESALRAGPLKPTVDAIIAGGQAVANVDPQRELGDAKQALLAALGGKKLPQSAGATQPVNQTTGAQPAPVVQDPTMVRLLLQKLGLTE